MARNGRAQKDLATADGHDRYVPSETRDILSAGHEGVYEWAAEHLVREGTRFLDLGCGTGYGSSVVAAAGGTYDGVDSSPAAIDYATANFARPGVRFFVADLMEDLPPALAPRSYDVVFSSEVLEHVLDPFAFVGAMAAFVGDDGTGFVGTPNRLWSKGNMPGGQLLSESHVMEFTPPALVALLRTHFDEVDLMFRMFPEEATGVMVPARRPPLVRETLALARAVAPTLVARLGDGARRRLPGRQWTSGDVSWLRDGDPGFDMNRCVGLAAVGKKPRR